MLHKVGILVKALIHKPFTPRPEKVDLDEEPDRPVKGPAHRDRAALEQPGPKIADTERVADLISQKKRDVES
jgi:hypothetical protein